MSFMDAVFQNFSGLFVFCNTQGYDHPFFARLSQSETFFQPPPTLKNFIRLQKSISNREYVNINGL